MLNESPIFTPEPPALPPPKCIQTDVYSAADAARQRLQPKPRFPLLPSLPSLRSPSSKTSGSKSRGGGNRNPNDKTVADDPRLAVQPEVADSNPIIRLDNSAIAEGEEYKDKYQWAVIYENQRGITAFSIPYYSKQSLLPTDPYPFTIPSSSSKQSKQPNVSFKEYPLPDGTWRWVSKSWMIDMRSDTGEVQHDGFEYNWMFRTHNWRAEVGTFSAGGWVRRRRWVRLMMRPARRRSRRVLEDADSSWTHTTPTTASSWNRHSVASSCPPSVIVSGSELPGDIVDVDADEIWKGQDVEADWARCHSLMKCLGRDGRKLELWKKWLGLYHYESKHAYDTGEKGKQKQKQWTEDETWMPSEVVANTNKASVDPSAVPPVEYVTAVLRKHGDTLLRSFIFPESRAQFIKIIGHVGLLPQLKVGLEMGSSASEVDFWSYTSGLGEQTLLGNDRPNTIDGEDEKQEE